MRVVGVDPGKTGAVGVLWEDGRASVYDLTGSAHDDVRTLNEAVLDAPMETTVVFEKVGPHPREGVRSVWTFAQGFGVLLGAAISAEVRIEYITPATWKRIVGIPAGSDKTVSRDAARCRFPALSGKLARAKDSGRAEALLIAAAWKERKA